MIYIEYQAIPLTIGIFASVFAVYGHFAPDWVLWKWPLLYGDWSTIEFVGAGVGMGMLILLMAALHFHKRGALDDKLEGLELADDYMTKPDFYDF